jgi:hypothetical protein
LVREQFWSVLAVLGRLFQAVALVASAFIQAYCAMIQLALICTDKDRIFSVG